MPKARKYIIEQILALPIDKRILEPADVIYEGARDNAETGTWYDWIAITGHVHAQCAKSSLIRKYLLV